MKKFISYFVAIAIIGFSMLRTDFVYGFSCACEATDEELKEICSSVCKEKIDEDELLKLVDDGLSYADAEFYIRFDRIVKELEKNNLNVNLNDYSGSISDEDFAGNIEYYRSKILEGDREALAKALLTLSNIVGTSSIEDEICRAVYSDGIYEHIFKDGTRITFSKKGSSNNINDYSGTVNTINDGYYESLMEEGAVYPNDRTRFQEGEWKFQSGLSYSKVYMYVEYELDEESGISKISYARGGQSSYGVVNIANGTGAAIIRGNSIKNMPAEARNEVIFNVTSSFGATFSILSISMNPGMNWTQYILFKLYPADMEYGGAKYQWYAAEYK